MGIFDNITKSLKTIGTKGGRANSVIGIDIGSASIKVVQLRREKGRAVLETYGEIALGPYSGVEVGRATNLSIKDISKALLDVMKEANITAKSAGISIPFSASLTSIIEMPKMSSKQLSHMIPLEARKYIPANINDVTLDWFVIPDDPAQKEWSRSRASQTEADATNANSVPEKSEVLIVAIHNEELIGYQTLAQNTNLSVGFYELEIFGVIRSAIGEGIAPIMVVDFGASTTKVYIVEKGIVRFSHLINKGSQDLTLAVSRSLGWNFNKSERRKREQGLLVRTGSDAEEDTLVKDALLSTLGRIFSDINRVLLSYERKYGKNVAKMIMTGGGAGLNGLSEYAMDMVKMEVVRSDSFQKVSTPAFLEDVLKEVGPEFTVAVGMALRQISE